MQKWEARWNINHDLARSGTTEVGTEWVALKRREVKDGLSGGKLFFIPGFSRIWSDLADDAGGQDRTRAESA
jgi:hypothetical protein